MLLSSPLVAIIFLFRVFFAIPQLICVQDYVIPSRTEKREHEACGSNGSFFYADGVGDS